MAHRRTRVARRPTDWTGHLSHTNVAADNITGSVYLHQATLAADNATITRIRGSIQLAPSDGTIASSLDGVGSYYRPHIGIQVVNRRAGATGTARNPALEDDMEGGEWLWLHCWHYGWRITSGTDNLPDGLIQSPWDVNTVLVDIKAQRKMDLSQDELLLTYNADGNLSTNVGVMNVCLRMLWKHA